MANLIWVNTGNENQLEVITTTNHEFEEDVYESDSLPEPEAIHAMVYGEQERLSSHINTKRRQKRDWLTLIVSP